jgi:hypothetical protein
MTSDEREVLITIATRRCRVRDQYLADASEMRAWHDKERVGTKSPVNT